MSESRELLATLRDIAEPPPPVGSPPLLIVANAVLAVLIVALVARRVRRRRRAWLDEALAGIERASNLPPAAARLALAGVLRRVMRYRHGGESDALHGEAWLMRLDEEFGGDWFTRGAGRAFGDALYAPPPSVLGTGGGTAGDSAARLGTALARRLKRLPRAMRNRPRSTDTASAAAASAHAATATGRHRR